jgi:hypothetical protein
MNLAASELGFGAEAEMRDRTQMQFIALLARQGAHRFILKGGMAMRALYGSTRLTKDVDFDGEDSLTIDAGSNAQGTPAGCPPGGTQWG